MRVKMIVSGLSILLVVLVVTACGGNGVNGNGKAITINLEGMKKFKTGFVYVKSPFENEQPLENLEMKRLEEVAKTENINFYMFNAKEDLYLKYVKLHTGELGFYQSGQLKEKLNLDDIDVNNISSSTSSIDNFVKNVKEYYLK